MITTSSSPSHASSPTSHAVSLFPSYTTLPSISLSNVEEFIRGYVLPTTLSAHHDSLAASTRETLTRSPAAAALPPSSRITKPHVQICGHMQRDSRCGILGPVLEREFREKLANPSRSLGHNPLETFEVGFSGAPVDAEVSLISHIGGHKFAGNVIVYVPEDDVPGFEGHALAGRGIWYGRVEPRHVEGIVRETIMKGVVIRELFRGGIEKGGEMLKL